MTLLRCAPCVLACLLALCSTAAAQSEAAERYLALREAQEGLNEKLLGSWEYEGRVFGMTVATWTLTVAAAEDGGEPAYLVTIDEKKQGGLEGNQHETFLVRPDLVTIGHESEELIGTSSTELQGDEYVRVENNAMKDEGEETYRFAAMPGLLPDADLDHLVVRTFALEPGTSYEIPVWRSGSRDVDTRTYTVGEPEEQDGVQVWPVTCAFGGDMGEVTQVHWLRADRTLERVVLDLGGMKLERRLARPAAAVQPDSVAGRLDAFAAVMGSEEVPEPTAAELLESIAAAHEQIEAYSCRIGVRVMGPPVPAIVDFAYGGGRRFRADVELKAGEIHMLRSSACDGTRRTSLSLMEMGDLGGDEPEDQATEVGDGVPFCEDVPYIYDLLAGVFSERYVPAEGATVRQATRAGRQILELDVTPASEEWEEIARLQEGTLIVEAKTYRLVGFHADPEVLPIALVLEDSTTPTFPAGHFTIPAPGDKDEDD